MGRLNQQSNLKQKKMKNIYQDIANYNLWANRKMVNLFTRLDEHLLETEIISSFPSVKLTFLHIWDAEQIWLSRLKGHSMTFFPSKNFRGSNSVMFEQMLQSSQDFLDFISQREESFFNQNIQYQTTSGAQHNQLNREIIHHVFNHGTYHRGQLTTMARQLGLTHIEATDYIFYLRERQKTK